MQSEKEKQYSKPGSWYKKGVQEGPIATKYRKGACENCGAVTHKKKDCLEVRIKNVNLMFYILHIYTRVLADIWKQGVQIEVS